jgi:hypothetical protein
LEILGLDSNALLMMTSYLTNRTQIVKLGEFSSKEVSVTTGVPQGSILGPLLFLAYSIDLPECIITGKVRQYADDTQLVYTFDVNKVAEIQDLINADLSHLSDWCRGNHLKINASKSHAIPIMPKTKSKHHLPEIKLNGDTINYKESARNLGVIYDSNFSFEPHIDSVILTAGRRMSNLSKKRGLIPAHILKRTIETDIIYPMMYGSAAWASINATQVARLQKIQNWGARLIEGRGKYDHCRDIIEKIEWVDIQGMIKLKLLTFGYSAYKGEIGSYLKTIFKNAIHPHRTRSVIANKFIMPSAKSVFGASSFTFKGPRLLNEMISHLHLAQDRVSFRKIAIGLILKEQHLLYFRFQRMKPPVTVESVKL